MPINNAEARRKTNEEFAERLLSRWSDKGPASGHALFHAILQKAIEGPIATPERARALLPILLGVLDEMTGPSESGDESGHGTQKGVPAAGVEPATSRSGDEDNIIRRPSPTRAPTKN